MWNNTIKKNHTSQLNHPAKPSMAAVVFLTLLKTEGLNLLNDGINPLLVHRPSTKTMTIVTYTYLHINNTGQHVNDVHK